MSRKLASVVEIDKCEPIPDTERLSVATMKGKGWKVVTARDEFKSGDLAVYFEIDSYLPADDERYAFLRERCLKKFVSKSGQVLQEGLRIRTCKLRGVISQGLLMPIRAFQEIVERMVVSSSGKRYFTDGNEGTPFEDRQLLVGTDVTELLSVKHYDEIAEALRPACSGNPVSADAMGKFPSDYIPKTDQERIQNLSDYFTSMKERRFEVTEKNDGCVRGDTLVETDQGLMHINHIVEHKLKVSVLSYNEELKVCEYKPVISWHRYPITKPMVRVAISRNESDKATCRTKGVYCTSDHLFFTSKGWVPAGELHVGDIVYRNKKAISAIAQQMIAGCLLGDSSVHHNSVFFGHCEQQLEYLEYKKRLLGELWLDSAPVTSGYGSKMYRGHTVSNAQIRNVVEADVSKFFSPVSVAFWLMDDGCLVENASNGERPFFVFSTQGLEETLVDRLIMLFKERFGVSATKEKCSRTGKHIIRISNYSTDTLSVLVAPFIVPCMKYKMPKEYRNVKCVLDDFPSAKGDTLVTYHVLSVEKFNPSEHVVKSGPSKGKKYYRNVFDIEVEGNHNYFGNGVLIHNSSVTMFYSKTVDEEQPFGVCSRNLRLKPTKENGEVPLPWKMADKYGVEAKIKAANESCGCELAFQGELVGPGVNGNRDLYKDWEWHVFNVWNITEQRYLLPSESRFICNAVVFTHVPVICEELDVFDTFMSVDDLLKYAEGKTAAGNEREGLVFKSVDYPYVSFKAVSNRYLLKGEKK